MAHFTVNIRKHVHFENQQLSEKLSDNHQIDPSRKISEPKRSLSSFLKRQLEDVRSRRQTRRFRRGVTEENWNE